MRRLPEVVEAKELMIEAVEWSVFSWMLQKSKVREAADVANAALDHVNRTVKSRWSDGMKAAYQESSAKSESSAQHTSKNKQPAQTSEPTLKSLIEKVKVADAAARRARRDAEATFGVAERQLNIELAREGCKKAIHAWELHEKAIRLAETVREAANAQI